eukprot:3567702-Ditylum_brightwellii.AAC.1
MVFEINQKVWANPTGRNGYHHATVVGKIDKGEAFLFRWRKCNWNNSIVCARNMRPFIASLGLT